MYIQRPRFFIAVIIAIIVGLVILLLASPDASNTSVTEKTSSTDQTSATEETAEQQFERTFDEELAKAKQRDTEEVLIAEETVDEELSTIQQLFTEHPTLPYELTTTELRLFGYYVILKNLNFRDILTENDVSAIIDELKQFQPEDVKKLVHHTDDIVKYANNIEAETRTSRTETYGYLRHHYLTYQADDGWNYKVSISPTIDEILLRAVTEHPEMDIYYQARFATNPLFMQLSFTKNNNIIPLIQFFLDNGVDINTRSPNSNKTIFSSVGTLEIAQLLLANGADHTIIANDGETPLIQAVTRELSNELIKFLIDSGVDLHAKAPYFVGDADITALEMVEKSIEWLRAIDDTDHNPKYEPTHTRIEKAEEVVRIIEQALEAEKKSAK